MEPVGWGVLGAADIALRKVIPAMRTSKLSRVVAIASRQGDRAEQAAASLGIARAYGSYGDLLEDEAIEAVYIPLPNHLHAEWTLAAARAGKHVLCEKPLAMSVEQALAMIEGCRKAGVLLMEAFMYRLHPLWQEARRLVAEGMIGELRAVQSFFSYHNVDPANIRNVPEYGGGALMDIGCYPINVARMMFGGEPTAVVGRVVRDPVFGTDVLTSAVLEFGERHATFSCSTQLEDDQRVHLVGSRGRLLIEIPYNIPPDRPTRILRFWDGDPPVSPLVEGYEIPAADPYAIQADAFSEAVRRGGPVPTPPEDALGNLAVIASILEGAEAGVDLRPLG